MARPNEIELGDGTRIPILYEDRSVIAIDKPAGWMLVPYNWDKTDRNLHLAIASSIEAGHFWARSRGLRYLRHVHRLDADTSGLLLLAKSPGALNSFSRLFESRRMEKIYLAVVEGIPRSETWRCQLRLAPDPDQIGRMKADPRHGKDAETGFRVLERGTGTALVEARPVTGRTHQIRVHLAEAGHPVLNDPLYGSGSRARPSGRSGTNRPTVAPGPARVPSGPPPNLALALRAVALRYSDPFLKRTVRIEASIENFRRSHGFGGGAVDPGRAP